MLDPKGRKDIVDTVLHLNKDKGITIVYITHKMEEAILADRVIAMKDGHIELMGSPKEVFTQVDRITVLNLRWPPRRGKQPLKGGRDLPEKDKRAIS